MKFKFDLKRNGSSRDWSQINYRVSPDDHSQHSSLKNWLHHHVTLQVFSIVFTLILMFLLTLYFITPLNRIQKVSVGGNSTISRNRIIKDLRVAPGDSLARFYFHRHRFRNRLMNNHSQLKNVKINFAKWNRVNVHLNEYHALAYLKLDHKYYVVIPSGRIAGQVGNLRNNCPVLVRFSKINNFKSFIDEYRKMPDEIKADISRIVFAPTSIDPDRIHVYMNDGNQVYANFETWGTKMKYYSVISRLMKRKGIINFEVGAYSYSK